MTQQDLGEALGVSKMMVSHWENGKNRVDPKHFDTICRALDVEIGDLTGALYSSSLTATEIAEQATPYGSPSRDAAWIADAILDLSSPERAEIIALLFDTQSAEMRKQVMKRLVDLTS